MGSAIIATSSAALIESVPFILAAVLLAQVPRLRRSPAASYLGCGCGAGPSARSLPAAVATAFVFGPAVAAIRWFAAVGVSRIAICKHRSHDCHPEALLATLYALIPAACMSALTPLLAASCGIASLAPFPGFAAGILVGAFASPCAFGIPFAAAAFRTINPAFATGYLCVTGIADLRAFATIRQSRVDHDALAYVLLALTCALVAVRGGGRLVHPLLAIALAPCALVLVVFAWRYRSRANARARIAPALMLAGLFAASPPPAYHVTETTLADAFAGEQLTFTGIATQTGATTTIVRYAITCCRADAAPIVVRLAKGEPQLHGWISASGALIEDAHGFALRARTIRRVATPDDPFVYR